jgi:hypothetical protein
VSDLQVYKVPVELKAPAYLRAAKVGSFDTTTVIGIAPGVASFLLMFCFLGVTLELARRETDQYLAAGRMNIKSSNLL